MRTLLNPVLSIITALVLSVFLSACGANPPAGSSAISAPATGGITPTRATGVTMYVMFPVKNTTTGLNALLSASTQTLSINIVDRGGGTFLSIGSGSITAPPGGGFASTTVSINTSPTYTGPVDVYVTSRDAAGNWLGQVSAVNQPVVPNAITSIPITLVEIQQGMIIPASSAPIITSPDGSTYQVTKVFLNRFGINEYNMAIEANVIPANASIAPYIAINYASTLSNSIIAPNYMNILSTPPISVANTPNGVYNGLIAGRIQINNFGTIINNQYEFRLNFSQLSNIPTLSVSFMGGAGNAIITNPVVTLPWNNNVFPTTASGGVAVIIN